MFTLYDSVFENNGKSKKKASPFGGAIMFSDHLCRDLARRCAPV
jgi:hypothetical protein